MRLLRPCRNAREWFWRKEGCFIDFQAILKLKPLDSAWFVDPTRRLFYILLRKYLFYFNYRFHVPVVMYVLLSLHNLLLVVNSSINFIIYCCVGKRFRQELKLMLTPYCNFVCRCVCNDQKDQADAEDPVPCQFWSLLNETWNNVFLLYM